MEKYKLISFDMFQTLVDVNTQKEAVMPVMAIRMSSGQNEQASLQSGSTTMDHQA